MLDVFEFQNYSNVARNLFNYMNGKINTMNLCTFRIEVYDCNNQSYANINYPNDVYINIATIMDSWEDRWSTVMDKKDYICTIIAWSIAHELFHADQLISMMTYNSNADYRLKIEGDVQRASYDWIAKHKKEISNIGGFDCKIHRINSEILPDVSDYRKASPKEYYLQTIANVILRDLELFKDLKIFYNDTDVDNMLVVFNNTDSVEIKKSGVYLAENIGTFSELAYKYAGQYSTYHVSISTQTYTNRSCIVNITVTEQLIEVMRMKK